MPRPSGSASISPGVALRGAAAGAVALALAWFSFAGAVSNNFHRRNPDTALKFVGDDAVALAAQADRRFAAAGASAAASESATPMK